MSVPCFLNIDLLDASGILTHHYEMDNAFLAGTPRVGEALRFLDEAEALIITSAFHVMSEEEGNQAYVDITIRHRMPSTELIDHLTYAAEYRSSWSGGPVGGSATKPAPREQCPRCLGFNCEHQRVPS